MDPRRLREPDENGIDYVGHVRRAAWLLIVLAVVGCAVAYLVARATPRKYTATTQLFVSIDSGASALDLSAGGSFLTNQIDSYAAVVPTAAVLQPVERALHTAGGLTQLEANVTASVPSASTIVAISAVESSAQLAARVANAAGHSFATVTPRLQDNGKGSSLLKVTTIAPAVLPSAPSSPRTKLDLVIGLFLGLFVGFAVAVIRGVLMEAVESEEDIFAISEFPVLSTTPETPSERSRPIAIAPGVSSQRAESYRQLRTSLQFLDRGPGNRVYLLASAVSGEGKTVTAINLAMAFAEVGKSTVLVDLDLRRPSIAQYLGLEDRDGVTAVLDGSKEDIDDAVLDRSLQHYTASSADRKTSIDYAVLPCGPAATNPVEMVSGSQLGAMIQGLRERYEIVVIDSPPLLAVSDASVISSFADGVVVVIGATRVRRTAVRRALDRLATADAPVRGFVLNRAKATRRKSDYSSYYSQPSSRGETVVETGRSTQGSEVE